MTKKAREYFDRWCFNIRLRGILTVYTAYRKPSELKQEIWEKLVTRCDSVRGIGLSVISYSVQFFTAGFMYKDLGEWYFVVETPTTSHVISLTNNDLIEPRRLFGTEVIK